MNRLQPKFVPALTDLGYKKMPIPPKLYDYILGERTDIADKT